MDRATRPLIAAAASIVTVGGWLIYRSLSSPKASPSSSSSSPSSSPSSSSSSPSSSVATSPSSSSLIARAGRPIAGGAIIVVDPLSTGAMLAQYIVNRGIPCIRVLSRSFPDEVANCVLEGVDLSSTPLIQHRGDFTETARAILALNIPIAGLITGCETGVETGDELCEHLGLPHNDRRLTLQRRNKYLMGEQVRSSGVRAVAQARVTQWADAVNWLNKLTAPYQVIIKPSESSGTDGVFLCSSADEVRTKYDFLMGRTNMLGLPNQVLVLQEFLQGQEYVVDTVSRDGVHKVVAIWQYDKRSVNGADFVYHGMTLIDGAHPHAVKLGEYMCSVLDALRIRWGPGHGEIIMTSTGPCLVEIGARPHGGEGSWLPVPMKCLGYDICSVSIDAIVDEKKWADIPLFPTLKNCYGGESYFVSRVQGKLIGFKQMEELKQLPSYVSVAMFGCAIGRPLRITVDCMSTPGGVVFMNSDRAQLDADLATFRAMDERGFFDVVAITPSHDDCKSNGTSK